MHTVFLSEPALFRQETCDIDPDQEEITLLAKFSEQHGNVNFDRLPTCPLCIEKLDPTVTGLQQAPCQISYSNTGVEGEPARWPGQIEWCEPCRSAKMAEDDLN